MCSGREATLVMVEATSSRCRFGVVASAHDVVMGVGVIRPTPLNVTETAVVAEPSMFFGVALTLVPPSDLE